MNEEKQSTAILPRAKSPRITGGFVQTVEANTGPNGACAKDITDFLVCTIKWGLGSQNCAKQLKNWTDCLNPVEDTRPSPTYYQSTFTNVL